MSAPAYASVNGLQMYYEVHGSGPPLVLLHGGALTIGLSFGPLIPALAETHRVIAIEMQGHGHTADIDREMTPENFASIEQAVKTLDLIPDAQLAILPDTTHMDVARRPHQVLAMVTPFLDA